MTMAVTPSSRINFFAMLVAIGISKWATRNNFVLVLCVVAYLPTLLLHLLLSLLVPLLVPLLVSLHLHLHLPLHFLHSGHPVQYLYIHVLFILVKSVLPHLHFSIAYIAYLLQRQIRLVDLFKIFFALLDLQIIVHCYLATHINSVLSLAVLLNHSPEAIILAFFPFLFWFWFSFFLFLLLALA